MADDLGATGKFPEGKVSEHDEGALRFGIAEAEDYIVVNFGTPVAWFTLDPDLADQVAAKFKQLAHRIRKRQKRRKMGAH